MKKMQIFFLSIICLLVAACSTSYTDNEIILKAESLLYEHPDSAYKLLNSIPNPQRLPKADYAAWCLHYTHARYKLYMDITSDSLIKVAVNYYADSKYREYSGTSYYVLGCVSELLHRNEDAMLAYKNAILALEGTKAYNITGLATVNMGYIYEQDKNYSQANVCIRKSLYYFNLSGNKKCKSSSYLELSNMSFQLDYPFDSTLFYSNNALKLAKEVNDTILSYQITAQQGEMFCDKNNRVAINGLLLGFNHCPELRNRCASFLAYLYSEINKIDSATYYLKIAEKDSSKNELGVIKNLAAAVVSKNHNDFKQAYQSMEEAYLNQDTIFLNRIKSQTYRIDKQFDLSEKEKENAELKIANRTKVIFISLLIIFLLIILVVYQRKNILNKQKQAVLLIQQQKLEFELREKGLENAMKHELLLSKLQQRIEMTLRFNKIQQGVFDPKKQEEFVAEITNQVILAKNEWQYYIDETNSLFNNKITDLKEKHTELTPSDIIVIVLISLGIDISDSCVLLNSSKETIYGRRKRIKKHLGLDNEIDLEEWIKQIII